MGDRVLITSCYAKGGVVTARELAAQYLNEAGFETSFASYAPYKIFPNLSAPLWQPFKRAKAHIEKNHWWVGTKMPEWEFMRSSPSQLWDALIHDYQHHLIVSGPPMAAYPFVHRGINPLCWLGTSYWDERLTQYENFSWPRKLMTLIDKKFCEDQEKEILENCSTLAVSTTTAKRFQEIAPSAKLGVLPVPVDINFFRPQRTQSNSKELRIGFVGRLNDSRKNLQLLFHSTKKLLKEFPNLRLMLVGGELEANLRTLARKLEIESNIEILGRIPSERLSEFYNQLDVFVIASLQEGLCIAGIEAMACGTPVVSTRCGGPEDFVIEGKTGSLCNFEAQEMANSIRSCLGNKELSKNGRDLIENQFSQKAVKEKFLKSFLSSIENKKLKQAA